MNTILTDELRISRSTYSRLKPETIEDLLSALGLNVSQVKAKPAYDFQEEKSYGAQEGLARFTDREMREFVKGVGPKTRAFLDMLAEMPPRFNVGELLKKLKKDYLNCEVSGQA